VSARRFLTQLCAAAAFAVVLTQPPPVAAQGRPDCTTVLRKLHAAGRRSGSDAPDAARIASKLGVDVDWVERCATAYGRRVKVREPVKRSEGGANEFSEKREIEEFDELAREERETVGDTYYTVIDNDAQERKRLRALRDEDTINEWNPIETHEWEPDLGREWRPYLHDDDLGNP
jgi:hypothetical protein